MKGEFIQLIYVIFLIGLPEEGHSLPVRNLPVYDLSLKIWSRDKIWDSLVKKKKSSCYLDYRD